MALFSSFSHIYLPVRDVDASIDFYSKNFDFALLRKYRTSEGGDASAYLRIGECLLELTKARGPVPADEGRVEPRIGITVSDMDAAWKHLMDRGVTSVREPYDARTFWGKQAQVSDENGYGISLREWALPDSPFYADWQPRHEGATRLA